MRYYQFRYPNLVMDRTAVVSAKISISGKVRVAIGAGTSISGPLLISGDGEIQIGDRVQFGGANESNRLETHDAKARIVIGDDCFINGAKLVARAGIEIGARSILGECTLMDTDFHSVEIWRHEQGAQVVDRPIKVESNVWIANGAMIMKGVRIGQNSVVGAAAVVRKSVPENVVVAGNPHVVVRELQPKRETVPTLGVQS